MSTRRRTGNPTTNRRKVVPKLPEPTEKEGDDGKARMALSPSIHGAAVVHAYMRAPSDELDLGALVDTLELGIQELWTGDMKPAEAMLYGQATALQAIFTTLSLRANSQEYLKHSETYLRLALKAQSQCRTTLETLATIKAGPVIFARQANVAVNGPQQVVNNGDSGPVRADAHAREIEFEQTELLGVSDGERLDTRATSAPGRIDPALATVGEVDGAKNGRG